MIEGIDRVQIRHTLFDAFIYDSRQLDIIILHHDTLRDQIDQSPMLLLVVDTIGWNTQIGTGNSFTIRLIQ